MSQPSRSIESMTGFGEHRARLGKTTLICRARSLNHRFLDVKVRLPRADLPTLDMALRKRLSEVFKRGAIEVTLSLEGARDVAEASLNTPLAESYFKASRALGKKLKLKGAVSLDTLLRLPGVVGASGGSEEFLEGASDEKVLASAIEPALQALKAARQAEGKRLRSILLGHLDEMDSHVEAIKRLEQPEKERARNVVVERAQETLKLLASLSSSAPTDEFASRLREEAVFWIERRDFAEERDRLSMHLKEFRALISGTTDAPGRKLEFIQQEVLREINTLGTKAQAPAITKHTVELKTILERIREQLANVE